MMHKRNFGLMAVMMAMSFCGVWADDEPSASAVHFVECVNRARANPAGEASRYGIALNEGVPASKNISTTAKPPLAFNVKLVSAARAHAEDMALRDYFSHYTQGTNAAPSDRCQAAGYTAYSGENLAVNASTAALSVNGATAAMHHEMLFVDTDYPDRGHRTNMMSTTHREVGVYLALGTSTMGGRTYPYAVYSACDFGSASGGTYLCGVVYDDANGDAFYDVGEGLSNARLTLVETGATVAAWSSGAYSLPVTGLSGTYTLRLSFSNSSLSADKAVTLAGSNVKCDFRKSELGGAVADAAITMELNNGIRSYYPGNTLDVRMSVSPQSGATGDVYALIVLPGGSAIVSILPGGAVTAGVQKYYAGVLQESNNVSVFSIALPTELPAGTYSVAGLVVTQGADPYVPENWKSASVVTFTFSR